MTGLSLLGFQRRSPQDLVDESRNTAFFDSLGVLGLFAKFVERGLGDDAFGEDLVQFFLNAQLILLKFAKVRDHDCVLEVRHDHGFKHSHVVSGELSKTIIH